MMTVEEWWEKNKDKWMWSGAVYRTSWPDLWQEARDDLTDLYEDAKDKCEN